MRLEESSPAGHNGQPVPFHPHRGFMPRFRHIVFDCDGVLVDSEPLSAAVDHELLAECGIRLTPEEIDQRFVGLTSEAMIARLEAEFGLHLPPGLMAEKDRRLFGVPPQPANTVER